MIRAHPIIAAAAVIAFALFVLHHVRRDYTDRGKLTPLSALLQLAMFLLHGLASYSFVDSRLSKISPGGSPLHLAIALMAIGVIAVLASTRLLRWGDTVGTSVSKLQQSGPYRFTRNPQLMAYLVFLTGYVLLWPSWRGLAWLALYGSIAHLMVLTEEGHLRRAFGREYEAYCRRTPRYLGLPRRSPCL